MKFNKLQLKVESAHRVFNRYPEKRYATRLSWSLSTLISLFI
jgi:hypothetical protein